VKGSILTTLEQPLTVGSVARKLRVEYPEAIYHVTNSAGACGPVKEEDGRYRYQFSDKSSVTLVFPPRTICFAAALDLLSKHLFIKAIWTVPGLCVRRSNPASTGKR
jgi:hypothetical protein